MEIIKNWIIYKTGKEISIDYLFLVIGHLKLSYESKKLRNTDIFPQINIRQKYDFSYLDKYLGIKAHWNSPVNREKAWEEIKQFIDLGEIPVILVDGSKLLDVKEDVSTTYVAVHSYSPKENLVGISSVHFNGYIQLQLLKEIGDFSCQNNDKSKNSWVEFHLSNLALLNEYSLLEMIREKLDREHIVSVGTISHFGEDLQGLMSLQPLLKRIILKNLTGAMFHPWGPPAVRKHLLNIIKELYEKGFVSNETYSTCMNLSNQWITLRNMFGKSTLTQGTEIVERIIQKINILHELEDEFFFTLSIDIK
ncbi:hypothetical protein C0R09_08215 [Brevibacillus laterosporus]|uniref:hypothetical protein n=1 Tax=Brevibacillus laterosporus TaxID=1465 RepID=UPI000C771828|nr:hypothetical protein [Brevibacillus laterosporus]AUM64513.1 hypothetical protein C0R09_08215 [Brevibacillus laterosporus]